MWPLLLILAVLANDARGVAPTRKLNNGKDMPVLGLGTWLGFTRSGGRVEVKGDEVQKAVEWAIDAGYKHIDTAFIYNTEPLVGKGINKKIADGVVKREDLFVTTKLWNDKHAKDDVVPALRLSLEKLGLEYVDLYLIHWPVSLNDARAVAPNLKLNNGKEIPALGLGTWLGHSKLVAQMQLKGDEVQHAVEWAIDAGYKQIDTAFIYNTEIQVGKGINKKIADGIVKREDLFVTTKLWNDKHAKEDVVPALRLSLEKLGLEYVDLYLIHWPISFDANGSISDVDYLDTWQGMVEAQRLGLTRSIGVSNFNQQQLERLISNSSVVPQVLQVEVNLNLQQPSLLEYCRSKNITVTGFTPFGSLFYVKAADDAPLPRVDTPELVAIAQKHNKTVTQVTLRYLVHLGVIPIPKSTTKSRVEENLNVFDFALTEEERNLLKSYDRHYRTLPMKHWLSSKYYPFEK